MSDPVQAAGQGRDVAGAVESDFSFRKLKIATTCLIGITFASSVLPWSALSLLMLPMTKEFGWSRTEFSLALTVMLWSGGFSVAFFGHLTDKIGVRKVVLTGSVVVGLAALAGAFQTGALWQFYLLFGVFGAVGCSRSGYQKVIGALFGKHRGKALAMFGVESTLAMAVLPPLTLFLLDKFGWRGLFLAFGVIILSMVPLIYFTLEEPGVVGGLPSLPSLGRPRGGAAPKQDRLGPPVLEGRTLREVLRDRTFWFIVAGTILTMAPIAGMGPHMVAAIVDKGFTRADAVWILSLTTLIGSLGTLAGGYFVDKIHSAKVKVPFQGIQALGALCLAACTSVFGGIPLLVASGVLQGFAQGGARPMSTYFQTRFFGLRAFTSVYGVQLALMDFSLGLSPLFVGYMYDRTGSYNIPLYVIVAATALAAPIFYFLGRYRYSVDVGSVSAPVRGAVIPPSVDPLPAE